MFCRALTQRYLLMGRLDQVRHSRCSDPIGTTTWVTKTPWVTWQVASTQSTNQVEIPFCLIKISLVLFLGQLSICSWGFRSWVTTPNKGTQFTAHFCRFTMRNFMICFKTKRGQSHSTLGKISTQVFSLKDNQNTLWLLLRIALLFLSEERPTVSLDRLVQTFIRRVLTLFSRFWSSPTQLTPEAFCSEASWTCAILQDRRRFRKMKTWGLSTSTSSRLSTWVSARWVRLSQHWLKARRRITFLTATPSWPGFCKTHLEATPRPASSQPATLRRIVSVRPSAPSSSQIGPSKSWWKYKPIL